jgi:hypothetical protein
MCAALLVSAGRPVSAEETVSIEVTFSTEEVGEFSVSLRSADNAAPAFGTVLLDADQDVTVAQDFVLDYTDTLTDRGPGYVSLSIESFEPETPVPPFPGSDQVHFQIPNRYLTLSDVGEVVDAGGTSCAAGPITAYTDEEGLNFDIGTPRRVAEVAGGCGVGSASQPIELTLTVPAGVYPTTYVATVTIETTFD